MVSWGVRLTWFDCKGSFISQSCNDGYEMYKLKKRVFTGKGVVFANLNVLLLCRSPCLQCRSCLSSQLL